MKFIEQFKLIRKHEKISIKKLADKSGVNKQTIENWEYLSKKPTVEKFDQALNALGYELVIVKKGDQP